MQAFVAVLALIPLAVQADVVGSMTGPSGEKLLLTDELANCPIPEKYASYVVDARGNATATGCWGTKEDHVVIDWVTQSNKHVRLYWPMAMIDWGRTRNSKLRSPVL